MSRAAVCTLLGLAGCAQLFGLDETTSPPADAAVSPTGMSLVFARLSIGASLKRGPIDLSAQSATYYIDDPTAPSGLRAVPATRFPANDGWFADIPEGTRAAIEFDLPDTPSFRRLFAFPMRTIKNLYGVFEHPNPEPAPQGGTFAVRLSLPSGYAANEYFRLFAIGPWAQHQLTAAELPAANVGATTIGPVNIPYDKTSFPSVVIANRDLAMLTADDQMVALRYVGNDLTAAAIIPPFTQSGGSDAVTATLDPVPHAPLSMTIDPMTTAMRLSGTTPQVTNLSMAWSVVAAPAWQLASANGPVLMAAGVDLTTPMMVTAQFGNPFESLGWSSLFTWAANRSRTYTVPAMSLPMTLYAGLHHAHLVAPARVMDHPAGLPIVVSINKTLLNSDGLTIRLDPTQAVELGLVADRAANLYYQWNVYELVPNAAMPPTALEYKIVYVALATETTVKVPPQVFQVGKVYTIRGHCIQGAFPAFATGDLQDRDVPYAHGFLDSGVFTVAAP